MVFSSIGKYRHQSDYGHPYPSPTKGLTVSLLKGGYGWFLEKISCRLISRRKNSCKEIPGKTHWKKYLSWLIILKKNLTLLFVGEEDSITRGLEKKKNIFLPKPNHPHPLPWKVKWSAPKQASPWDLPYLVFYFLVPCLDCCSKRVRP